MQSQVPSPDIAAVLIVRDEARCIERCLESVRPYVDRMLVLDTGSTDGTPALAAACGAEVHHLPWPDDFSAARNHALELADADWNLVVDADEWIVRGGEQLRAWCGSADRVGKACVHSATDEKDAGRRNWISRLLPRGVRFEGRVHEQAVTSLPRERIELHIGHDGYLDDQIASKHGRNGPLLQRELIDRPGDPYLLYQIAKDAEMRHDLSAAAEHYGTALAATPASANWRHALIVRYLFCLGKTGGLNRALAIADQEMANWTDSPDFFFVVGNLALDRALAEPAHAFDQWLPLAATAWERCLEIGERPELEESQQGCGSYLARHNLDAVRSQMSA
ncbi:MAG TPA: glycosyltransferase family 2 protein [Sphingomonas sp.]|nr:glycosyltransferase family 2 protein [Sphingomonas sp.]